ncbi:MAG: ComF family protein [Patescibacteria group bacterium]
MVLEFFLDLLFPPLCVTCGSIGGYICLNCYEKMSFFDQPLVIDLPTPTLDELQACTKYAKTGSDFIHMYKFGCSYALAPTIGEIMFEKMARPTVDFLVPVPLHRSRQRERGFNQAELLAKHLSKRWEIPIVNALHRPKATTPQAQLDRAKRLTHLTDAFNISPNSSITGKTIALIDDVTTTGTTLNECARILKNHQAKKVIGLVFAHGD